MNDRRHRPPTGTDAGGSQAGLGLNAAAGDRACECGVVAFVLVGVAFREVGECLVENVSGAEVACDRDGVAAAGVRPRECLAADPGVGSKFVSSRR
jgi:hypothetical protein